MAIYRHRQKQNLFTPSNKFPDIFSPPILTELGFLDIFS